MVGSKRRGSDFFSVPDNNNNSNACEIFVVINSNSQVSFGIYFYLFKKTDILVILADLSKSYITNGDGSSKKTVQISAPSNGYAYGAKSAVVQGKLHLFGGNTDRKKVSFIFTKNLFLFAIDISSQSSWSSDQRKHSVITSKTNFCPLLFSCKILGIGSD